MNAIITSHMCKIEYIVKAKYKMQENKIVNEAVGFYSKSVSFRPDSFL